jgi:predicted CXXCH cytochrome family protein
MQRFKHLSLPAVLALALAACSGEDGEDGAPGTSVGDIHGTVTGPSGAVSGATVVTVPATSSMTTAADGTFHVESVPIGVYLVRASFAGLATGEVSVSVTAGQMAEADIALAAATGSVAGTVTRAAPGTLVVPVAGATVALVSATSLAGSASESPLEELAATSLHTALTGASGAYTISGVAPGRYFLHASPATADADAILPGGDASRVSFEVTAGATESRNVLLSARPPAAATYVGSSACLGCHGASHGGWRRTLHALVYREPGVYTANMDVSQLPDVDFPLEFFHDGNTVGPDNTGAGDALGLRISRTDEANRFSQFPTGFNILLGHDGGGYFVQTETADKTTLSQKYYVTFTFGGHGVYKQRWVTRAALDGSYAPTVSPGGDWSHYVLPVQYDEKLQPGVQPFHPYNATNWKAPASAGGSALNMTPLKSFDFNCAGCHFTGMAVAKTAAGNFQADAVDDANGPIDFDGDGASDEIEIGCEACHGPGSAHLDDGGAGGIVTPQNLAAERENQLCGVCHNRGHGQGSFAGVTGNTEYPSRGVDTLEFPRPGLSRSEYATFHADAPGLYKDGVGHSRQHHQQFNDVLKSTHFKNPYDLLACSTCHDMHDRQNGPSLVASAADNTLCLDCHGPFGFALPSATYEEKAMAVSAHISEYMVAGYDPANEGGLGVIDGFDYSDAGVGRCTGCHMPKTAASQSRFVHEQVSTGQQPSGPRIRGDISSHVFDAIWPAVSESLYLTETTNRQIPNSCGSCHNAVVGATPAGYTW